MVTSSSNIKEEKLRVDDLFFIPLDAIYSYEIYPYHMSRNKEYVPGELAHKLFKYEANDYYDDELCINKYTLVKYLGEGRFAEYYTGLILQSMNNSRIPNEIIYDDYIDYMVMYDSLKHNPLFVDKIKLISSFDSNIRYYFAKQNASEMRGIIKNLNDLSINNSKKRLRVISNHDEIFAYAEDMILTFEKKEF